MGDILEYVFIFLGILFVIWLFVDCVLIPYWYIAVPVIALLTLIGVFPRIRQFRKNRRRRRVEARIRDFGETAQMDILPFLTMLGETGKTAPEYTRMCREYVHYQCRENAQARKLNRQAELLGIRKRIRIPGRS